MKLTRILNEAKIESRIKKLVANCNALIKQAIDKDGDPIPVEDPSSTWASQYVYDKIVFNGTTLRIHWTEVSTFPNKKDKEVIKKANLEFDGIEELRLIQRMYKKAIKNYKKYN